MMEVDENPAGIEREYQNDMAQVFVSNGCTIIAAKGENCVVVVVAKISLQNSYNRILYLNKKNIGVTFGGNYYDSRQVWNKIVEDNQSNNDSIETIARNMNKYLTYGDRRIYGCSTILTTYTEEGGFIYSIQPYDITENSNSEYTPSNLNYCVVGNYVFDAEEKLKDLNGENDDTSDSTRTGKIQQLNSQELIRALIHILIDIRNPIKENYDIDFEIACMGSNAMSQDVHIPKGNIKKMIADYQGCTIIAVQGKDCIIVAYSAAISSDYFYEHTFAIRPNLYISINGNYDEIDELNGEIRKEFNDYGSIETFVENVTNIMNRKKDNISYGCSIIVTNYSLNNGGCVYSIKRTNFNDEYIFKKVKYAVIGEYTDVTFDEEELEISDFDTLLKKIYSTSMNINDPFDTNKNVKIDMVSIKFDTDDAFVPISKTQLQQLFDEYKSDLSNEDDEEESSNTDDESIDEEESSNTVDRRHAIKESFKPVNKIIDDFDAEKLIKEVKEMVLDNITEQMQKGILIYANESEEEYMDYEIDSDSSESEYMIEEWT